MTTLLPLVVAAAATLASAPADAKSAPSPAPAGDLARLQGTWTAQAGPNGAWPVRLEVAGCRAKVRVSLPLGQVIEAEGRLTVDESTNPRRLDWSEFRAPDGSPVPTIEGIYRIEEGRFVVCNAGFHDARPTEFEPGDGVLADVVRFEPSPADTRTALNDRRP